MSILLDALKRSESQRDLGKVPTLQTATESPVQVSRGAPGWLPAAMSLAAAGLIGWMGLAQFSLPEGWTDDRLAAAAKTGSAETASPGQAESETANPAPTGQSAKAGRSILPQLPESAAATSQEQAAPADAQVAQRRLGREVRDYAAQEPSDSAAVKSAEPSRDNAVRQTDVASVELDRFDRAPAEQASPSQPTPDQQPYEPEIINYWQVPEKMREGLPDLRISVLVYAELPENRFLLMNGERLREGQELPNGLLLEEIRRDRAIFNYRNYRFYLKS